MLAFGIQLAYHYLIVFFCSKNILVLRRERWSIKIIKPLRVLFAAMTFIATVKPAQFALGNTIHGNLRILKTHWVQMPSH
jgi:hypothetical protein